MNIVYCLDNNYVPFCGTSIESVCENNPEGIQFHIISASLSPINKNNLKEIVTKYDNSISFYDVEDNILEGCVIKKNDYVSIATYLRILIPIILPQQIDKVLYLDCDLIVCRSLSELFQEDIHNYACAAALDAMTDNIITYNRLQYDSSSGYFNAGVIFMNLTYWRMHDITNKMFQFMKTFPERLLWLDQDVINGVLLNKIKRLPFKYNMMDAFYRTDLSLRQSYLDEISRDRLRAVIIHFTSSSKPWHSHNMHPLRGKFLYYLTKTPWSGQYPPKETIKHKIKYWIKSFVGLFGLTIAKKSKSFQDYIDIDKP